MLKRESRTAVRFSILLHRTLLLITFITASGRDPKPLALKDMQLNLLGTTMIARPFLTAADAEPSNMRVVA